MKNTNESITDIIKMFKKEKVHTVEDFFGIDSGSPKEQGVKGLILKMVDVMTPDINMKVRDKADARAQATRYLVDYIKDSFIYEIENLPTRRANDWEDFAEYIESEAWGENIGWKSLINATKELYDHANEAHTEALPDREAGGGLTGDPTQATEQLRLMLGVNTIPLILLAECLRALGKRMHKAKIHYNKKRISKPMNEQTKKPTFSKDRLALMFYALETAAASGDVKQKASRATRYAPYYKILQDMYNDKPTNLSAADVEFLNTVNKNVDILIDKGKLYQSDLKKANSRIATTEISENKILEDYIKTEGLFGLLTKGSAVDEIQEEKFEETPFGQIVADEVNYVVNNMPEIQLARDVLGEQEAVAAGTDIAQTLLTKLRQEMVALIPGLVKQEVEKMQAELADETQKAVASMETEEPAV